MRLLILLSLIIGVSCNPVSTNKEAKGSLFDLPAFSRRLVETQVNANYKVIKTSIVNEIEDKFSVAVTDSVFWATELYLLLNGDLNKPSLIGEYIVQNDVSEPSNNLTKTVYSAVPDSKATLKQLEIKYLDSPLEVRQILVHIESKNTVYQSQQSVHLWVNNYKNKLLIDSLITEGFNKTILMDSIKYRSKVVVVR